MSTKNKMNIIGYLGADPELRYTTSGRAVANLRIATTERWTDKAGTAQEHTEWHRVVAWGNLAEVSAKYLKKGSLVSVEGPIRSRKFTDKEGVERYAYEVIASEVLFLDRAGRQKQEDASPPLGRDDKPVLSRGQVRASGNGGQSPVAPAPAVDAPP